MNYIFSFKTEGRNTYSVNASSREEAAKLLLADYEDGDEKYLIESDDDGWCVDGSLRTQTQLQRIESHIVDEREGD